MKDPLMILFQLPPVLYITYIWPPFKPKSSPRWSSWQYLSSWTKVQNQFDKKYRRWIDFFGLNLMVVLKKWLEWWISNFKGKWSQAQHKQALLCIKIGVTVALQTVEYILIIRSSDELMNLALYKFGYPQSSSFSFIWLLTHTHTPSLYLPFLSLWRSRYKGKGIKSGLPN